MQAEGLSKSLASVEWMNASEDPALTCPPHLTNVYSALFFNADCCAVLALTSLNIISSFLSSYVYVECYKRGDEYDYLI